MRLRPFLTHAGMWSALIVAAPAWSRETASTATCQAAAARPPIATARTTVAQNPADLQATFRLADAWSDAGCFADALQALQSVSESHPDDKELVTRLRVARSLIGEEHYFDDLARVEAEARLKRAVFRCSSLADQEACDQLQHLKADDLPPRQKAPETPMPVSDVGNRVAAVRDTKTVKPKNARMVRDPLAAARYSNEAPASRTH